jgi:hypothetical protein
MSEELRWNLSLQIVSGPTVAASGTLSVDAYSKSQVVVPARTGGVDGTLDVSVDTSDAELLLIRAGQYVDQADATRILGYAINPEATPPGPSGNLTAPLMLMGADVIELVANPVELVRFTNPIETPITVDIVVGGDVTP